MRFEQARLTMSSDAGPRRILSAKWRGGEEGWRGGEEGWRGGRSIQIIPDYHTPVVSVRGSIQPPANAFTYKLFVTIWP